MPRNKLESQASGVLGELTVSIISSGTWTFRLRCQGENTRCILGSIDAPSERSERCGQVRLYVALVDLGQFQRQGRNVVQDHVARRGAHLAQVVVPALIDREAERLNVFGLGLIRSLGCNIYTDATSNGKLAGALNPAPTPSQGCVQGRR